MALSAVFLVRVWLEDDLLRARITESLDLADPSDVTVSVSAAAEEIEQHLHDWLECLTADNGPVTSG
jgi:hypothetical protein